jgi:hypothetical protein
VQRRFVPLRQEVFSRPFWRALWRHYGWPLLLYTALSIALTWPVAASFTSQIPGTTNDAHNGLWVMWHVKEALQGRFPLFTLPLLYYPHGATLLTHVPGPLTGFLALPFWLWGAEAAHNGAVLVSFGLTGFFTYLLARTLDLGRGPAFVAGLMLLLAPMHLAGLWGHTTKVFLGGPPLALAAFWRLLRPGLSGKRAALWSLATAGALLLTMIHDSFQMITALMAIALLFAMLFWRAGAAGRRGLAQRLALLAAASAVVVGPLFVATVMAAYGSGVRLDLNFASFDFQPDLIEFALPPGTSLLFGRLTHAILARFDLVQGIETAISLSWVGLALSVVAVLRGWREARLWAVLTAFFAILSIGPALKVFGRLTFTEYQLPIIMPYTLLTALPGLDFLRTPGRFMQIGFAALAMTAAYGLAWLNSRNPRRAPLVTALVILLLLVENWPHPWPRLALRPVPDFYRQLAGEESTYGVLDIPFAPTPQSAAIVYNTHYQMYQMTHRKGISMGYISRTYESHPVLPCLVPALRPAEPDVLVNGRPVSCSANSLFDLAANGYRYVVWHQPQPLYEDYRPGSWGEQQAAALVAELFGGRAPDYEDELVRVYTVPPPGASAATEPVLGLQDNWYVREGGWRWARSPATLFLSVPQQQAMALELTPDAIYEPGPGQTVGTQGRLRVELDGVELAAVELTSGETARIPLRLGPGTYMLRLALDAGTFRPSAHGSEDARWLSFSIRQLNLVTDR